MMVRSVAAVVVLVAAGVVFPDDKDKDPIRDKLFAAKVAYDKEIQLYRKQAGDWFDKREEAARKDGNKKAVDQIKAEREAFDESGELPKAATTPTAIKQKPALAMKALETAYAQAVKDYAKEKKGDEAAAVEKEWKTLAQTFVQVKESPKAIDLLALVDPKTHATVGVWKKDGKTISGTSVGTQATLQLPYEPGEEYDIEVGLRRTAGRDCFFVGLVVGGRRVNVKIDGVSGEGFVAGLEYVDGKQVTENMTKFKGELLGGDKEHTIACSVRDEKIDVTVDGKPVTAFKGEFKRLSIYEGYKIPNKNALCLICGEACTFQFERITVTPVKGKGTVLK